MHKTWKCKNDEKHENDKCANHENVKTRDKILRLLPPLSISALKPGPVVPPGIEKVPDQAARKTQSVDFGHLSDILPFLGGGRFLTLFLSLFHDFDFITFWWFWFSAFCHFLCFSQFLDFVIFGDLWFLIIFCHFSLLWLILVTFCH